MKQNSQLHDDMKFSGVENVSYGEPKEFSNRR
jgi:hypothetical protein